MAGTTHRLIQGEWLNRGKSFGVLRCLFGVVVSISASFFPPTLHAWVPLFFVILPIGTFCQAFFWRYPTLWALFLFIFTVSFLVVPSFWALRWAFFSFFWSLLVFLRILASLTVFLLSTLLWFARTASISVSVQIMMLRYRISFFLWTTAIFLLVLVSETSLQSDIPSWRVCHHLITIGFTNQRSTLCSGFLGFELPQWKSIRFHC